MSNLYKTTAILFSSVLFFINVCAENYFLIHNSFTQSTDHETTIANKSLEKQDLYIFNRYGERLLNSIKYFPVPNFKNQINDFYSNRLPSEKRKLIVNSEYLSYAKTISLNLTNIIIAFPFHCFW
jgi:hypothetical protein